MGLPTTPCTRSMPQPVRMCGRTALDWRLSIRRLLSSNGIVYFGSGDGSVYALDASTGLAVWIETTSGSITSSAAVAGGIVYIGSEDGKLHAYNAAPVRWSGATTLAAR